MNTDELINTHYHVSTNTGSQLITDIVLTQIELADKLRVRIQMVEDLTGSKVKKTTKFSTTFENGEIVLWQPCSSDLCGIRSTRIPVRRTE